MLKQIYKYLIVTVLLNFSCYRLSSIAQEIQVQKPKHVILFIGDGMQLEHEIATSRYLTGGDYGLIWNTFPYQAYVTTWNTTTYNRYANYSGNNAYAKDNFKPEIGYSVLKGGNKPYPKYNNPDNAYFLNPLAKDKDDKEPQPPATDSAAAATAMATGVKTESGNISWEAGDPENGQIKTITEILKQQKDTAIGVITTVPFNHATPAGFLSHNADRNNYIEIAEEIIVKSKPDVIIGGGHPKFNKTYLNKKIYRELLSNKEYVFVEREKGENAAIKLSNASDAAKLYNKKLFGLFGGKTGDYEHPIPVNSPENPNIKLATKENPTLAESTLVALDTLSKDKDGFFLMAEQGNIDWANHQNNYNMMIGCVWDLNETVKSAIGFVNMPNDDIDWDNTLLIVTADHANSYMRLNDSKKLCKGCLPVQKRRWFNWYYPGEEVKYSLKDHTNELVSFYAIGNQAGLFANYEGKLYPETKIIDNTDIFKAITKFFDVKN